MPVSPLIAESPNNVSARYSGGPKLSAASAIGGASTVSMTTLNVPAMNDAMAAMVSAGPARPCRAIACPSRQVMIEADSPGTFISTEVIVPPYMQP